MNKEDKKDLPKGWVLATVGDVIKVKHGYAFKSNDYVENGIPLIRISNVNDDIVSTENAVRVPKKLSNPNFLVNKGDLLIAMSGATTGKMGVYEEDIPCLQNQRVGNISIISKDLLSERFRNYIFRSLKRDIEKAAYGGAQPNISSNEIESLPIPLPPLPEQQRIAGKIEKLFSRSKKIKTNLDQVPKQLERLRKSILAAAFRGDLTKNWREKNPDVESAETLLKKIHSEKPSKREIKKKPVEAGFRDNLYELPAKWIWTTFESACDKIFDGTHFSPKNSQKGEYMYITAKNIKENKIDLTEITYVSKEDHYNIYKRADVKFKDILYIKDGATTGIAAINNIQEEFSTLSSVGIFRVNQKYILPEYVSFYLNSPITKQRMLDMISGVAITRLTLVKLNNSYLALPPLAEQKEIVRRVEKLLANVDKLEAAYKQYSQTLNTLNQSILAKAFKGELVPQDPNDEPAAVLLERIKAEKGK